MPTGEIRFVGITAAARWMGCTPTALGQLARGSEFYRGPLYERARQEYPEIFWDYKPEEATPCSR